MRVCSKRRINFVISALNIISFLYVFYTERTIGSKLSYVSLSCQLQNATHSHVQLIVVVLIPVSFITFSFVSIFRVARNAQDNNNMRIPLGRLNNDTHQRVDPIRRRFRNLRNAIRLILMTSGMFLVTIVPAAISREIVLLHGVTWQEVETRQVLWASLLMRLETTFESVLFAAVNPIIYYRTERNLYVEFKRLILQNIRRWCIIVLANYIICVICFSVLCNLLMVQTLYTTWIRYWFDL